MGGPHLRVEVEVLVGERKRRERQRDKRITLKEQGSPLFPVLAVKGKNTIIIIIISVSSL